MTTQTCPDQATLENFLLGKLPESEQTEVSEHLRDCGQCMASANTLKPQDEMTQAIQARKVLTGDEAAVAAAAEKGKLLSSQLQTMQPDETVIGDKPQTPPADPNSTVAFGSAKTPDEAMTFLAPAQGADEIGLLGDYRVLELLGMGGMGMVFRAEDLRLKRQVALKVMKPSVAASRTAKDRFLREAQFTAAIEHDNIVQIFQVGEDIGVPFIAMPFLKGESLKTRQERVGRMSQKDVLKVGIQVAAGLAAAHERNLIHRDIKPDNIWIEEKTGRAKILDFGLVRATSEDAGLTQSGMVMGTPRYMAPEQALGQDVDHCCDLFSLGSVLYHLVSGKLPFEGSNVTATLMAVVQKDPKPLDAVISGLDPAFCDMIARMMQKNREDRPKSAIEVAKALTAILQKLKQADPTVPKAESVPAPVPDSVTPLSVATNIEALPVIVMEPAASLAAKKSVKTKYAPTVASDQPPTKPPARRFLAAAGAGGILLAILGIIVITIRDKDGKETVIRVPEGTDINVKADSESKVTIRQESAEEKSATRMAAAPSTNSHSTQSPTGSSQPTFTPVKPLVDMDLTPAPPLGSWKMGPEPPWFDQQFQWNDYSLKAADALPGLLDRPAVIPGVKRWNVDTVWPRGGIVKIAYSPDGKWLGVLDAHLHIYDAKTLELHQIFPGFRPQYGAFDFAWSPDSQRLVVAADQGGKVRVLGIDGVLQQEIDTPAEAVAVAWSPSGDSFAVGISNASLFSGDCIQIYNSTGELVQSFPEDAATAELGVSRQALNFSPDGKSLVAIHLDGKLRSWNLKSGAMTVIDDLGGTPHTNGSISWHPSGWLAVTGKTEIRVYTPALKHEHAILLSVVGLGAGSPCDLKWHLDGRRLLLAGGWLAVWDREEQKIVASGEGRLMCNHGGPADWNSTGEEVAFHLYNQLSMVPASFKQPRFQSPRGVINAIHSLAWSPDGKTLAQGSADNVRLWSTDGKPQHVARQTAGNYLDWSSDGTEVLAGGYEKVTAHSSTASRLLYKATQLYTNGSIADSPDGRTVIISRTDGHLQIVDRNGKALREVATGGNTIPYVAWSHATNTIAVAEQGQPLKFLDSETGWTFRTANDIALPLCRPVWSPDGKMLSLAGCKLWFDHSGKSLPDQAFALTWRPDGERYIFNDAIHDRSDNLFSRRNQQGLLTHYPGWSPRGNLIAIGTEGGRFTVWHEADFQPYWHGVLLPENKSATFSAAGELIDGKPEEIDPYLVYYLDRGDGRIETLTPAEFRKLLPGK